MQSAGPGGSEFPLPHQLYSKDPDGHWTWGNHPGMTATQMQKLQQTVRTRKHCFAYSTKDMPGYNGSVPPFTIKFKDGVESVFSAPRRQSPLEKGIGTEKNTELWDSDIIEQSGANNPNASCQHFPAKKDADGNYTDRRVTVDYRKVNQATIIDRYRLHRADDLFHQVNDNRYFSKIDLRSGFHQIPIAEVDRPKTAFWWGNQLWQYKRLPMGLCNSPAAFQRVMDHEINSNSLGGCAVCFIDDIIIHSQTPEEHVQHVAQVLDMLHNCGLRAHPDKSVFGVAVIEFLGFNVSHGGVTPMAAKVMAIKELKVPSTVTELQSVLGFMGYYRSFVPNYSQLQQPLNTLLKKGVKWEWTQEHQSAYDSLKAALCKEGNALRRFDEQLPCKVYTDWSNKGIGAVLSQVDTDGQERMVACISRSLNKHESNYSSFEGELLGAVWAIKTFRPYLHGLHFTVITYHQPLLWLMSAADLTGKHARWALSLQEYEFRVEHRAGLKHQNADVPSRFPRPDSTDNTGARLDEEAPPGAACLATLAGQADVSTTLLSQLRLNLLDGLSDAAPGQGFMDDFAPRSDQLLAGHGRKLSMVPTTATDEPTTSADRLARPRLQTRATAWVWESKRALADVPAHNPRQLNFSTCAVVDEHECKPAIALDTSLVVEPFFTAAHTEGITLVELFGGLAAGLQMCMDNGIKVHRYLYCDTAPECVAVARAQLDRFTASHPDLLPATACIDSFTALPSNVRTIQSTHLVAAGALNGQQWFVVAGWECQDLSPAGTGRGLQGSRSNTFYDLVRVVGALQQLQADRPPAYLLENSPLQHNWRSLRIRTHDYATIVAAIGEPATFDAAQMGSYAHRVRNYWSNLYNPALLNTVLKYVERPPNRFVDDILDTGRVAQIVRNTDFPPAYVCNKAGQRMQALPTLVAYIGSNAFREGKSGMVWDSRLGLLQEPNPDERERALGYRTGTTHCPPLTVTQRHEITGRCMDRNAVSSLMAICRAVHELTRSPLATTPSTVSPTALLTSVGSAYNSVVIDTTVPVLPYPLVGPPLSLTSLIPQLQYTSVDQQLVNEHLALCMASEVATIQDAQAQHNLSTRDAWLDGELLHFLQTGEVSPNSSSRVKQRAKSYRLMDQQLQRMVGGEGQWRTVPPPDARLQLIESVHTSLGHFGVKRTKHLLLQNWWWAGIEDDVVRVLSTCPHCKQINTSFNTEQPQLRSLPIQGLMYRWSCDLAGPLPTTQDNNKYLFVAIEHFSKNIEVMAIPDKEAATTAKAFLSTVLGRFGACAEVLTDQGGEWMGAFHQLLESCLIDHRLTSAHHPQANGLTERAVQTFKRAISKYCSQSEHPEMWDVQLHFIALGYRCSPQAATRCSPYQLLYGVAPTIPPAIKPRMDFPLQFDPSATGHNLPVPHTPEQAAEYLLERGELLKRHILIAGDNQLIAQHRDQLRFAQKRSGLWQPKLQKFQAGDFVYRKRANKVSTLQPRAADGIYKLLEVRDSGTLILQGRCGRVMPEHSSNCAPCHLTSIDPSIDPTLAAPDTDHACVICNATDREEVMLLCDFCNAGYHLDCLQPPLHRVPPGDWVCPYCTGLGITVSDVQSRRAAAPQARQVTLFRTKAQRERDAQARQLAGRLVQWTPRTAPHTAWGKGPFIGELQYIPDPNIRSRPLVATFVPGTGPAWDLATARRHLLPAASPLALTAAVTTGTLLVKTDDLDFWVIFGAHLMGTPFTTQYAQQLLTTAQKVQLDYTSLCRPIPEHAAAALRKALAPGRYLRGLDGWGSSPAEQTHPLAGITRALRVLSPRKGDFYQHHPMDPRSHALIANTYPVDVYFTYAPPSVLDALLPLQYKFCHALVCALVPVTYCTRTNIVRNHWLHSLQHHWLVRFVPVSGKQPFVWLLLAKEVAAFGNVDAATFARTRLPLQV